MKTRYAIINEIEGRKGETAFLCSCQANWSKDLEGVKGDLADMRNEIIESYDANDRIEFADHLKEDLDRFDRYVYIIELEYKRL